MEEEEEEKRRRKEMERALSFVFRETWVVLNRSKGREQREEKEAAASCKIREKKNYKGKKNVL